MNHLSSHTALIHAADLGLCISTVNELRVTQFGQVEPKKLVTGSPLHVAFSDAIEQMQTSNMARFEFENWDDLGHTFEARMVRTGQHQYLVSAMDITSHKAAVAQGMRLANTDHLTGVSSRTGLKARLEVLIAAEQPYGLFLLDVNDFKTVNDHFGHLAGDEVLRQIAKRIQTVCREEDFVARFGGDEFVIVMNAPRSRNAAVQYARRILGKIAAPILVKNGVQVSLNASVGVLIPKIREPIAEVLHRVDLAMYCSKSELTKSIKFFEPEMLEKHVDALKLKRDLRNALDNNELLNFYQPIRSLSTERICKAEALVRWQHPTRGLLPPLAFIELAEEMGEIARLGQSVLERSLWDLQAMLDLGFDLGMTVNVSALQIRDAGFVDMVRETLRITRTAPKRLTLEITEAVQAKDPKQAHCVLQQFAQMGVDTAIDDFGAGYSSLQYLATLPAKVLKIDKSFVFANDRGEPQARRVLEAMIGLGHTFGMTIVAEGVETLESEQVLRELGCDMTQGYYYSKPVPFHEFLRLLRPHAKHV